MVNNIGPIINSNVKSVEKGQTSSTAFCGNVQAQDEFKSSKKTEKTALIVSLGAAAVAGLGLFFGKTAKGQQLIVKLKDLLPQKKAAEVIQEAAKVADETIKETPKTVKETMTEGIDKMSQSIKKGFSDVSQSVSGSKTKVFEGTKDSMSELSQSVREAKTKVVDSTKELLEDLGKTVSETPASVKAEISGKITDTADGITDFTNDTINSISRTSENLGDKVSKKIKRDSERVKNKVSSIGEGAVYQFNTLISYTKSIIRNLFKLD